jgi:hypothetical protein
MADIKYRREPEANIRGGPYRANKPCSVVGEIVLTRQCILQPFHRFYTSIFNALREQPSGAAAALLNNPKLHSKDRGATPRCR